MFLVVCLSETELCKNYQTDFHDIGGREQHGPRKESVSESGSLDDSVNLVKRLLMLKVPLLALAEDCIQQCYTS